MFPRGGQEVVYNKSAREATKGPRDVSLFAGGNIRTKRIEVISGKKRKDPSGSSNGGNNNRNKGLPTIGLGLTAGSGSSNSNKLVKVDPVTLKGLNTGCLVVGYVLYISENCLTISLPGGLTGVVHYPEISDAVYRLYTRDSSHQSSITGSENDGEAALPAVSTLVAMRQMVRCYVLDPSAPAISSRSSGSGSKRAGRKNNNSTGNSNSKTVVLLSMRASLINRSMGLQQVYAGAPLYGSIVSREDHGYMIHGGMSDWTFFLPAKAIPNALKDGLQVGQPVECVCADVNHVARTVNLRAHPKAVYSAVVHTTAGGGGGGGGGDSGSASSLAFQALQAGMRLQVVVDKKLENGIVVNFLGLFYGTIDLANLAATANGSDAAPTLSATAAVAAEAVQTKKQLLDGIRVGQSFQARILWVDLASKTVRLTMLPHVLQMRAPAGLPALGELLTGAVIVAASKSQGLLLSKPTPAPGGAVSDAIVQSVYIPRKHLAAKIAASKRALKRGDDDDDDDEEEEEEMANTPIESDRITKVYKVGQSVPVVRIRGYHLVEGLAVASNMREFVRGDVVHASDIRVGQVLSVTVTDIKDFGLVVKVLGGGSVTAICPTIHTSDALVASTAAGSLRKKFKVGQKCRMRVWEVTSAGIIMTHKKTLVELPQEALVLVNHHPTPPTGNTSTPAHTTTATTTTNAAATTTTAAEAAAAYLGCVVTGVVTEVSAQSGLGLRFFDRVRGVLSAAVLVQQQVLDAEEAFRTGQVLKAVVIGIHLPPPPPPGMMTTTTNPPAAAAAGTGSKQVLLYLALDLNKNTTNVLQLVDSIDTLATGTITCHTSLSTTTATSQEAEAARSNSSTQKSIGGDRVETGAEAAGVTMNREPEFVSGRIYRYDNDSESFLIRLDKGGKMGKLHKHHLFDFADTADKLVARAETPTFNVGDRVENALVLHRERKNKVTSLVVTLKPLLLYAAKQASRNAGSGSGSRNTTGNSASELDTDNSYTSISVPCRVADVSAGQVVAGYIVKVDTFGVIVRFRGALSALAPRPHLADRFLSTAVGRFRTGDSIRCVVQRVEDATERVFVTFKSSQVPPSISTVASASSTPRESTAAIPAYLPVRLREQYLVASTTTLSSKEDKKLLPNWGKYPLGSVVKGATVTSLEEYGVVLTADDQTTMLLARHVSADRRAQLALGQSVKARVLDIDYAHCVLEVSLETDVAKVSKKTLTPLAIGATPEAQILLVKEKYLVVHMKKTTNASSSSLHAAGNGNGGGGGSALGLVALADYHLPTGTAGATAGGGSASAGGSSAGGLSSSYSVGQTVAVRVEQLACATTVVEEEDEQAGAAAAAAAAAGGGQSLSFPHATFALLLPRDKDTAAAGAGTGPKAASAVRLTGVDSFQDSPGVTAGQQKFLQRLKVGQLLEWEVQSVSALECLLLPVDHLDDWKQFAATTSTTTTTAGAGGGGAALKGVLHVSSAIDVFQSSDQLNEILSFLQQKQKQKQEHEQQEGNMDDDARVAENDAMSDPQSSSKKAKKRKKQQQQQQQEQQQQQQQQQQQEQVATVAGAQHPFHALKVGTRVWCHVQQVRKESRVSKAQDKGDSGHTASKHDTSIIRIQLSLQSHVSARISKQLHLQAAEEGDKDSNTEVALPFRRMLQVISVAGAGTSSQLTSAGSGGGGGGREQRCGLDCPSLQAAVVVKVEALGVILALSPYITARMCYADVSADLATIRSFQQHCFVGLRLVVLVTSLVMEDKRIKQLSVSRALVEAKCNQQQGSGSSSSSIINLADADSAEMKSLLLSARMGAEDDLEEGQVVNAVINLSGGFVPRAPAVMLSLLGNRMGRVCATELWDRENWMDLSDLMRSIASRARSRSRSNSLSSIDDDHYNSNNNNSNNSSSRRSRNNSASTQAGGAGGGTLSASSNSNSLALPDGRAHGTVVRARVMQVGGTSGKQIELSLRPSRLDTSKLTIALRPDVMPAEGSVVSTFVSNTSKRGCFLRLTSNLTGIALMRDLSDDFVQQPEVSFPVGKLCPARLLTISQVEGEAKLSLKDSVVVGHQKAHEEIQALQVGATVTGTVQRVTQEGVYVALQGTSLTGLSRKAAALSDPQHALSEEYEVGDVVRCKVLSVEKNSLKVGLGLRAQYFRNDDQEDEEEEDEDEEEEEEEEEEDSGSGSDGDGDSEDEEEKEFNGFSTEDEEEEEEEEEEGMEESKVSKLKKETKEVEDDDDDSDDDSMEEGEDEENEEDEEAEEDDDDDNIRLLDARQEREDGNSDDEEMEAMIRQASLYPAEEDEDEEEEDEDEEESSEDEEDGGENENNKKPRRESMVVSSDDDDDDDDDDDNATGGAIIVGGKQHIFSGSLATTKAINSSKSDVLGELDWRTGSIGSTTTTTEKTSAGKRKHSTQEEEEKGEESEEDEDEDGAPVNKKLRTKQKEAARRKEERLTRQREAALADGTLLPSTRDDFERILIAQPNSSYLWVQYMAFHLQNAAAVDGARAVASRALRSIDYREEDEKYNVWVALLNMEHKYGTNETLSQAFDRAVVESKGKLIHLVTANIYEQAGDLVGAQSVFAKALKRPQYKKSKKVWAAYHQFLIRKGDVEGAKAELARSMQSLSRHKHVDVISKYAMAEFDCEQGSADRGRHVFEELLSNFPKRNDLWNLYVDKEIKGGYIPQARRLFERMISSNKLSTRTMKAIFKKFLDFEIHHGTAASAEAVKEKARDYIRSIA